MTLNARRSRLIHLLLTSGEPQSARTLARALGVSPRAVWYDLNAVRPWLKERGVTLETQRGEGLHLRGDPECLQRVAVAIQPQVTYDYALSGEERLKLLLTEILGTREIRTTASLCEMLFAGRQTVLKDVAAAAAWLEQRSIRLERKPGTGIWVAGSEGSIRRAIFELMAGEGFAPAGPESGDVSRRVLSLAFDECTPALRQRLEAVLARRAVHLTDEALDSILAHVCIAVRRCRQGHCIEMDPELVAGLRAAREHAIASALAAETARVYGVELPGPEEAYLTMHLLGAKLRAAGGETAGATGQDPLTMNVARDFLSRAESVLGVDLSGDSELLSALVLHLQPIFHRLHYGLTLRNPLLDEIKLQYPELFTVATFCAGAIAEAIGVPVPEAETGFLALHLGAALERRWAQQPQRRRAMVVCGSGIGTARFLAFLLSARVPELEIVGAASAWDAATEASTLKPDVVITTLPIDLASIPTITINALPTDADVERVRSAVQTRQMPRSRGRDEGVQPGSGIPRIASCLTADRLALDVDAPDWQAAVRAAGELLVRAGDVSPPYVDAMVQMIHRLGPYVVIAPGIAMPHAVPASMVNRVCLSLVRLRHPVGFGHRTHDPVDLIFALGGLSDESHLTLLAELMRLFQDTERLARIRNAPDPAQILSLLQDPQAPSTIEREHHC